MRRKLNPDTGQMDPEIANPIRHARDNFELMLAGEINDMMRVAEFLRPRGQLPPETCCCDQCIKRRQVLLDYMMTEK